MRVILILLLLLTNAKAVVGIPVENYVVYRIICLNMEDEYVDMGGWSNYDDAIEKLDTKFSDVDCYIEEEMEEE